MQLYPKAEVTFCASITTSESVTENNVTTTKSMTADISSKSVTPVKPMSVLPAVTLSETGNVFSEHEWGVFADEVSSL